MSGPSRLHQAAVRGTFWNYATFALSKSVTFLSVVLLARILMPEDFGLFSLGLLAINLFEKMSDGGIGAAYIYLQSGADKAFRVGLLLSILTGATLTCLALAGAPLIAAFFDEPQLVDIIRVLAASFIISGVSSIPESLLKKELHFRKRIVPELTKSLLKGGVSITLALLGWGVWSLVWGQMAGRIGATALYMRMSSRRLKLEFDRETANTLLRYGLQIVGVNILGTILMNADYLIIGHRLDAAALGFYTMAFRLPELAIINICYLTAQVVFPTYAKLQDDLDALRPAWITTLRFVSLFTVPAGIGMAMIAPDFVSVFFSDRWAPAAPAMQVLALSSMVYSLSFNAGDLYKATGRPSILTRLGLFRLSITLPVLWYAARYGIVHVALGLLVIAAVMTTLELGIVSRILALRPVEILAALRPAGGAALVMAISLLAIARPLSDMNSVGRLATSVACGALFYSVTIWVTDRKLIAQAIRFVIPSPKNPIGTSYSPGEGTPVK